MLKMTMSTTFVPGTNLKGEVAGANWTFLLPSLEVGRIVCIGIPQSAALLTLARLAQSVVVLCTSLAQAQKAEKTTRKRQLSNVRFVVDDKALGQSLAENSVDLVWLVNWRSIWQLGRQDEKRMALQRLLKSDGLLYFEWKGIAHRLFGDQIMGELERVFGATQTLWLTPTVGGMETAVPISDKKTTRHFLRQKLYGLSRVRFLDRSVKLRPINRIERSLLRHRSLGPLVRRYGALIGQTAIEPSCLPPQYLQLMAQESGVSLDNYRWGLSARGKYNSRKVLFFLFERESEEPKYIVKITRGANFNTRLENEYRALALLKEMGVGDLETLPQPVFFGRHAGLVMVGETIIDGVPFRQRTKATADCLYGVAAAEWLIELGATTANPTLTTPVQVAAKLRTLLAQFVNIYQLTPAQHGFLERQITTIANSEAIFPLVFQHGDPGTWNIMVTGNNQVAFLDWEAAEPEGIPLWDLFYFLRSYCTWSARLQGTRDSLVGFTRQFLAESSLSSFLIESTRRYCERVQLAEHLVEPLFYTCWMHRALKEATRLAPKDLQQGHYFNLLRVSLEKRNESILQDLFSSHESQRPTRVPGNGKATL